MRGTLLVAVLLLPPCPLSVYAQAATPPDAFETITYRDSGGFAGGGRGIRLTLTGAGKVEANDRSGDPKTRTLECQELAALHAAVAAVDWSQVKPDYRTPNAYDLGVRNLTIVIRGQTFETHVDSLAKEVPAPLHELFDQLDALYERSTGKSGSPR
ncbi:MAG TPA: hypothetical protein VFK20_04785 [Vicinamibacterales bacterium]|nr:hypothetical protein [Vicinamibacterales bacterium]